MGGVAPRVWIVSAPIDAHHEHLFAGVFLDRLAGAGHVTVRRERYEGSGPCALDEADLLVLVRPRFPEVPPLVAGAARRGVPIVVVSDDNWLAAGAEYPRFHALFAPGMPALECFLAAVRAADATLVYSEPMEEDLRPYARRVVRLPAAVDLDAFTRAPVPPGRPMVVGYAGSPRWELSGFTGLARFVRRRGDVRVLVIGHDVPDPLRGVADARLTFVPWQRAYRDYARILGAAAPDVLLAPLDATRFSASKVPIKLFDSAAVGAAGIYSRVAPYVDVVSDGVDGLLVDNEPARWEAALERLYADPALGRRLAAAALEKVRATASVERALDAFHATLRTILSRPG